MKVDLQQLDFINSTLRKMVTELEDHYGVQFTVTSLYRMNNEGSVHGQLPLRGVDLRCYDSEIGYLIEQRTNRKWTYDPARPEKKCCMYHNVGQGAHLHLQVHAKTTEA